MYGGVGCVGNLGIRAPMGLVVEPGFSYYPPITIGSLYQRAMRERYIDPRYPISSTGLGVFTGGTYLPPVNPPPIKELGVETTYQEAYTEIIKSLKAANLPIPEWLQPYMKYLPGWETSPEHSEMAEVSKPVLPQPIVTKPVENKSVKYLLLGGAAIVAFMALRKK